MAVYNPKSPSAPDGPRGAVPDLRRSANAHIRLTHADRDAVAERLKDAYTEGRLDEGEFDERLDTAMKAKVQADLEPLIADITPVAAPASAPPMMSTSEAPPAGRERMLALGGHASGYFLSAFGPLLVLLIDGKSSSFVRRHAVEALNYQLTFVIGSIVLLGLGWLILPAIAWGIMLLGWVFLPAVAGLVSLFGGSWKYPFTLRPVKE